MNDHQCLKVSIAALGGPRYRALEPQHMTKALTHAVTPFNQMKARIVWAYGGTRRVESEAVGNTACLSLTELFTMRSRRLQMISFIQTQLW